MTICTSCGREFEAFPEASSDGEGLCPQCAAERLPGPAPEPVAGRLRQLLESPTIVLIALNTLVYLAMAIQGRNFIDFDGQLLQNWGANSGALTSGGEWWRLFTSTFEHGGIIHIALNMWCLYSLGWLAELLFGRSRFTLLYVMCGIGGSLGSICWRADGLSVGASGAIFGIAGALIPAMMLHGNQELRRMLKGQLTSIAMFVVYNLIFGAAIRGTDNAAHIGGLLTGLALGVAFPTGRDRNGTKGRLRVVAGTALMLAVFVGAAGYARQHDQFYSEYEKAREAHESGDVSGAVVHAMKATELKPDDSHAQFMLGALLLEQRRYSEAIAPFTISTQLRPTFGPSYINLCLAQLELNQTQQALASCEQGAKFAPTEPEAWFNLGRVRYALHDLSGARDALAKAVALNPNGFDENRQYALMLIANGETASAVPYLQKAHDLRPQDDGIERLLIEARQP